MTRGRIIALCGVGLLGVLALFALLGRTSDRVLLAAHGAYSVAGQIAGETILPGEADHVDGELTLWTLGREYGKGQIVKPTAAASHGGGDLVSRPFPAPDMLGLFLAGNYKGVDNRLHVRLEGTRHWRELYLNHASADWIMARWPMPEDWRGKKIRVVARLGEMTPGVWVGVSAPLSCSWLGTLAHQLHGHTLLPLLVLHLLLFLAPGLLLVYHLGLHRRLGAAYGFITAASLSALLGYCAFWAFLAGRTYGFIFSTAALAAVVVAFGISLYSRPFRQFLLDVDVAGPALLTLCVGLLYLALLLTMESTESVHDLARGRFITVLHGDNAFPMLFAEGLSREGRPGPLRFGDFLSSDRPPLQAGVLLLQRPIMGLVPGLKELHYLVLGGVAQLTWIGAAWTLCRVAALPWARLALVFCLLTFSGFFLFNSVHVWPKLLAGSLTVLASCIVLQRRGEHQPTSLQMAVVGGAAALGLLAHGGSAFPTAALLILLLLPARARGRFPGGRRLLVAGAVFACLMTPWFLYQKLYDPPGNRLVKWHLGGVKETDSRSSLETVLQSYRGLGAGQAISHKAANLRALAWQDGQTVHGYRFIGRGQENNYNLLRGREFLHVLWALGLLNLGWLVLAATPLWSRLRRPEHALARGGLYLGLASLLIWVLAMFGPGTTHVFQGSHATMILLFFGLAVLVTAVHRLVSYALAVAGACYFSAIWVFSTPPHPPSDLLPLPNMSMVLLAVLALLGLLAALYRLAKQ